MKNGFSQSSDGTGLIHVQFGAEQVLYGGDKDHAKKMPKLAAKMTTFSRWPTFCKIYVIGPKYFFYVLASGGGY